MRTLSCMSVAGRWGGAERAEGSAVYEPDESETQRDAAGGSAAQVGRGDRAGPVQQRGLASHAGHGGTESQVLVS